MAAAALPLLLGVGTSIIGGLMKPSTPKPPPPTPMPVPVGQDPNALAALRRKTAMNASAGSGRDSTVLSDTLG